MSASDMAAKRGRIEKSAPINFSLVSMIVDPLRCGANSEPEVISSPNVLVIASLRRKRLRHNPLWHTVRGSMVLLGLLGCGLSGCGGSGPSVPGTPAGNYTVTVTATSGSTVQKATLTLVVK
jgi:hypothetical protein